ncbi:hypothetical protein D3C75_901240 [compost metagenome]
MGIRRFLAVDVNCHVIEEHFWRHRPHGIRAGGIWRRQFLHAITQFLSTRQVEVAPRARFRLVAELFQRIRFEVSCRAVSRVGKHHFAHDLGNPTIVSLRIIGFRFVQNGAGTAHVVDILFRCIDRWQLIQRCRVAVEPAEVKHVGSFDIVAHRTVVAPAGPGFCQPFRQRKAGGDFIAGQAFVGHSQGLIVDITVHIALAFHQLNNVFITPGRPVVLGHDDLSFVAPALYRRINILRPRQRVANFGPAQ